MSDVIETTENGRKYSESSDSEYDPQFKPIVSLPEVVVSTNEENEIEILKIRAKLYRWAANADPAEWKERGTGELKILHNTLNHNVRVVMRRDQTLKVCANHFIVPWMELTPKSGTDKAFVYSVAADFADEEPKKETFAVKFGSVEYANLFNEKFDEARDILKTKCSLYNGEGDKQHLDEEESEKSGDEDEENIQSTDESTNIYGKDLITNEVTERLAELEVSQDKEKSAGKDK